jgi:hypothetical protein
MDFVARNSKNYKNWVWKEISVKPLMLYTLGPKLQATLISMNLPGSQIGWFSYIQQPVLTTWL